jgi:uncharacterized repeat protein (TIGR03803 family)
MTIFRTSKQTAVLIAALSFYFAATATVLPAQTFTVIARFDSTDGAAPFGPLLQNVDGFLYGTTYAGGVYGDGTIFRIGLDGGLSTRHDFCATAGCPDGSSPANGLLLHSNGNIYGMTQVEGAHGVGTLFQFKPGVKTLYSFGVTSSDGAQPVSNLVQGNNSYIYGTTMDGGANGNFGTIFRYRWWAGGDMEILHSFCAEAGCSDGFSPTAGLVQGTDGNFYGVTAGGGANVNGGTVFQMTPGGLLTTIYAFCSLPNCTDGYGPQGLVEGRDRNFYGTTALGGASSTCAPGCGIGTVFKISPSGTLTTLHSFNSTDGAEPEGRLVQGTDGNFYGTTYHGGTYKNGTIFQITPGGVLTTLRSLSYGDGINPSRGLMQATDGNFYGTGTFGGRCCSNDGTVFRLSMGLGPFVKLVPKAATVSSPSIQILGYSLTGTTNVTFNGIPSPKFIVVSDTLIYAAIPASATTGPVRVTTPGGTLTSNVAFQVLP